MRRLMLLRHAKTESESPSGRDQDRRLDERGRRDAADIGGWISRHPPCPDIVLVSPAVRAQQTWNLAAEAMQDHAPQPRSETVADLYGADPAQLLQIVRMASATDPTQLMLVGHNPTLSELVSLLVVGARMSPICELKKGGIAALSKGGRPPGLFELSWVATPRLLRRLGGVRFDD